MEIFNKIYVNGIIADLAKSMNGEKQLLLFALFLLMSAVAGYLLGSISSAILISTKKYGKDIRTFGSGNAGATNMLRTFGKGAAGLTFLGDMAKCAASVLVGRLLIGETGAYIAGMFCMLGHIFPCYFKFKGGKGVVCAATTILLVDPIIFAVLIVVFAVVVLISRYVSLGSIICGFIYPAVVFYRFKLGLASATTPFILICSIIMGFMVILMHRENLKRLYRGRERKISFSKKNRLSDEEFEKQAKKRYDDEVYVNYDEE